MPDPAPVEVRRLWQTAATRCTTGAGNLQLNQYDGDAIAQRQERGLDIVRTQSVVGVRNDHDVVLGRERIDADMGDTSGARP